MKFGKKRRSTLSAALFKKLKFPLNFNIEYKDYKRIVQEVNKIRAQCVVDNDYGVNLPQFLGKIIILKRKPKITKLYSSTSGAGNSKRIFNLHSFQYIYKVCHMERALMRYNELYKFRPHRQNIKMPLYNNIMENKKYYYNFSDYHS